MKWLGFAWSSMALALGLLVATPDDLLAQGRGRGGGGGGGARPSMGRVGGGGAHPMGGGGMARPAPQMSRPSGGNIRPPVQMPQSRPSFGNAARPSMPSGSMGSPMARPAPGGAGGLPGNLGGGNRLPGGASTRPAPGGNPGLGGSPMTRPAPGGIPGLGSRPSTRPAPGGIPNLGGNSLNRPPQGGIGGTPTTRPAPQMPQNRPAPGATRPNLGNTQRPSLQPGSVGPTTRPAPGGIGAGGGNRPGVGGGVRPPGPGGVNLPNGGNNLPNGGNRPGQGNRPGIGDRPTIGNLTKPAPGFERPVTGGGNRPTTIPGDLNRPGLGGGNRPGIGGGNRPDLSRPGVNDLPGIGGNRPGGNRPGIGGNRPDFNGGNRPTTLPGTVNRPGIGGNRPDWNGNGGWNGNNRPGGWGGNGWNGGNRPGGIGNNNNIINNTNNNFNNTNINVNQWNRPAWDRPYNRPGWGFDNGYNNWGWNNNWNNNWNNSWHDSWHNNCINQHYHGWYNGCWNGYWGSNWYAPLAYGAVGWGLNSFFTGGVGYGYGATYVNPYYTVPATTVAVPTAQVAPYDYSQPVIVNNYVTTENTSQGSQAESSAAGGTSTATQSQETNPAFQKFDDGLALFKTGKYPDSLNTFSSALKDMPGDPVIHEVRALALFAIGDYAQAAAALNSLLASAPGMDWTTLSGLYGNVDDYTNQLRKLEAHCKANPKDAAAHFVLAYHYLVIGSKDSAINALKVVVANQPQDVTAKRMLDALSPPEPKTDSATQARSAEPVVAQADSKPPEGDAKPEPETDLVGTWIATAGKSSIELLITEDSKFTWKATEADKVVAELKGDLVAAGDAISLDTPDKGSMAGSVVSGGADNWTFIPPGAPADSGLKFSRKK